MNLVDNVRLVGADSTAIPQPTGVTSTSPSGTTLPTSSKKKSSNAGAIAGGVVGGVVAVLLIIGLIIFLRRRKPAKITEPFDSDKLVVENTTGNALSTIPSTPAPAKYYVRYLSTFLFIMRDLACLNFFLGP